MLLEPFCLPEYKIIRVLQQSYLTKHVQNVLGLEQHMHFDKACNRDRTAKVQLCSKN